MAKLRILSANNAKGWYRVRGTRKSNEIEKLAIWSAICQRKNGKNTKHLVVGMIPADIGRNGYDYRYFTDDVAGYVHKSELKGGFVNAEAFKRLDWPDEESDSKKAKSKKAKSKKSAKKNKKKADKKSKAKKAKGKKSASKKAKKK